MSILLPLQLELQHFSSASRPSSDENCAKICSQIHIVIAAGATNITTTTVTTAATMPLYCHATVACAPLFKMNLL